MPLKHPKGPAGRPHGHPSAPLLTLDGGHIPRHALPAGPIAPDIAYQVVADELMLDGNARLNLATFVTTWMEPQAQKLMAECLDKNMIDKDEYPQTAELEVRCVNILLPSLARARRRPGHRLLDDRIERGGNARQGSRSSGAGRNAARQRASRSRSRTS